MNPAAPIARAFVAATWNTKVTDWVGSKFRPSAIVPTWAQTVLAVVGPPGLNENLVAPAVAIVLSAASPAKSEPRFTVVALL